MLYPLTFNPIFQERVWGGRRIETLYGKALPDEVPIGESWEISDRPDAVSVINNGPLAGRNLHWLVENHAKELFGPHQSYPPVFPWLIKILDAQDKLSLQVHPPADVAKELGGEPKTEMWYVAATEPKADIFVGLKKGVTRAEFEAKTADGTVANCFHRIEVKPGDCMMLKSGRVHALGAGSVIFEIQQNSDTTYRVFDWNRVGLDGNPRELHIEKSMRSIDFKDFEPALINTRFQPTAFGSSRALVNDPLFRVSATRMDPDTVTELPAGLIQVIAVLHGVILLSWGEKELKLTAGSFALVPACLNGVCLHATESAEFLQVQPGGAEPV